MSLSLVNTILGSSGNYYGASTDMSDDGTRMVVGAPSEGDGKVYIYLNSEGSWSEEATLSELTTGMPATTYDFGFSVSMNSDGDMVAVGDPGGDGAVYIFTRSGVTWSHHRTINPPNELSEGVNFGYSVALSGIDKILLVGAPDFGDGNITYLNMGTIISYNWTGSFHALASTAGGRIVSGSANNQHVGRSIAISHTGEWAAIGIDTINRTKLIKIKITGTGIGNYNGAKTINVGGTTVAISKDGDWALIGNQGYDDTETNQGRVLIYERTSTTSSSWVERSTITQPTPTEDAYFSMVGISGDGSKVVVANKLGKLFYYTLAEDGTATFLSEQSYFPSSLGSESTDVISLAVDETGSAIALGSDTVSTNTGAIYLYGLVYINSTYAISALPDGQSVSNPPRYWFCDETGNSSHSSGISLTLSGGSGVNESDSHSWAMDEMGRCGGYLLTEDTEITLDAPIENIGSIAFYFGVRTSSYSSGTVTIDLSSSTEDDLQIQSGTVAGGVYEVSIGTASISITYPASTPSQIIYASLVFVSDDVTLSGTIPITFS